MKLRLTQTNRKDYKTSQASDSNGMPYLMWDSFPTEVDLSIDEDVINSRIWIAGTSVSDKWFIKEVHLPGSPRFPKGGYTVVNNHKEVTHILLEEAILHPSSLSKRKKNK
jgi:hypothetical protein